MSGPISEPWDGDELLAGLTLEGATFYGTVVWDTSVRVTWWRRLLWRFGLNLDSAPKYHKNDLDASSSPDLSPDDYHPA